MEQLTLTLTFQSPYTQTGEPRADLPTGEVLAWDGERWANGNIHLEQFGIYSGKFMIRQNGSVVLTNVRRFAPLPTIYENDNN